MNEQDYDKLSEEEVRIKIAELEGWQGPFRMGNTHLHGFAKGVVVPLDAAKDNVTRHWILQSHVPDYLHDLNACHMFEEQLLSMKIKVGKRTWKNPTWRDYCFHLLDIAGSHIHATAAQKCKAFVLTMTE